jgi:hypothetical protein
LSDVVRGAGLVELVGKVEKYREYLKTQQELQIELDNIARLK